LITYGLGNKILGPPPSNHKVLGAGATSYGSIEIFMAVLAVDLVAPTNGKYHLKEYFGENKGKV
jgi:hypothetical protein